MNGEKIATTPLIAGGWPYELRGKLKTMSGTTDAEYKYVENGVIIIKGDDVRNRTGFGIFAGVDQPPSLWSDLSITGYHGLRDCSITKCCEILRSHGVDGDLTANIQSKDTIRFTLKLLPKAGHMFLAVPAPYVNGIHIVIILTGGQISTSTKVINEVE